MGADGEPELPPGWIYSHLEHTGSAVGPGGRRDGPGGYSLGRTDKEVAADAWVEWEKRSGLTRSEHQKLLACRDVCERTVREVEDGHAADNPAASMLAFGLAAKVALGETAVEPAISDIVVCESGTCTCNECGESWKQGPTDDGLIHHKCKGPKSA